MKNLKHQILRRVVVTIFFLILLTPVYAQYRPDESGTDKSFLTFKTRLVAALESKNVDSIKVLCADSMNAHWDCNPCSREEFFAKNGEIPPDRPAVASFSEEYPEDWTEALNLVKQGFIKVREENTLEWMKAEEVFLAPAWYFEDVLDSIIVTGSNVNVRDKPGLSGKVIYKASYTRLGCPSCRRFLDNGEDNPETGEYVDGIYWHKVTTPSGKPGYIADQFTSRHYSRFIAVVKIHGQWKLAWFFNGAT